MNRGALPPRSPYRAFSYKQKYEKKQLKNTQTWVYNNQRHQHQNEHTAGQLKHTTTASKYSTDHTTKSYIH